MDNPIAYINDLPENIRSKCVVIDNEKSDFAPVLSGVPQGSVTRPVLFLAYFNDLPEVFRLT